MASPESRKGAANSSFLLMIAAFAVIIGFLYWLNVTAEAAATVEVVEGAGSSDESDAMTVAADSFFADPMMYESQSVRLVDMIVASSLGSEAFFIENAAGPYLIKMGAEVIADSITVRNGDVVALTGMPYLMSDSVAQEWVDNGAIGENDKIVATFALSFLEVSRVEITRPAGGGE